MERNIKNGKIRKFYKKPLIRQVKLEPGDAVLTGCKVNQGDTGPSGNNPYCAATGARCKELGS